MNAREVLDLTRPCFSIKPLRVTRFRNIERDINKDFQKREIRSFMQPPNAGPFGSERADKTCKNQQARISHEHGQFTHPTNVFVPVLRPKPQIAIQTVANIVSIEPIGVMSNVMQSGFNRHGYRTFATTGEPGEPHRAPLLAQSFRTIRTSDMTDVPDHIFRSLL